MKTITIDGVEYNIVPKENKSKWRLPTIDELVAIYGHKKGGSAIDGFSSNNYWSSTIKNGKPSGAWHVHYYNDRVYYHYRDSRNYVRCVRDIDDGLVWSKSSEESMTWYEAIEYAKNLKE